MGLEMEVKSITNWGWESKAEEILRPVELRSIRPSKLNHEIRSVLHVLLGYLDIFHEEVQQNLDKDQNEMLERIVYFANRLSNLLDDMLTLVRKEYIIQ